MKTREEVEKMAVERYPICGHEDEYSDGNISQMNKQTAFLEGFLLCQEHDYSSVRKEPVAALLTTAMRYCDNDQRLQLISSLQERTEPKPNQ